MTYLISKRGARKDGAVEMDTIVKVVQSQARLAAVQFGALTDNTGVTGDLTVQGVTTAFVGGVASGSNLADVTTSQAALLNVSTAIASVAAKAQAVLFGLGLAPSTHFTDNSGRTPVTTIPAAPGGVTGATTGANVAAANLVLSKLNFHLYEAEMLVRQVTLAVGVKHYSYFAPSLAFIAAVESLSTPGFQTVVPAYDPTALGTAASPGVLKTEMDAAVARYMKDVKALINGLNACLSANPIPLVGVYGQMRSTPLNP